MEIVVFLIALTLVLALDWCLEHFGIYDRAGRCSECLQYTFSCTCHSGS
jgi:hypothetical protein